MHNLRNLNPKKIKSFCQNQFSPHNLPSSCSSFSFAMMINLLLDSLLIHGYDLDRYLVKHNYKSRWFGIPSFQLPFVIKGVSKYMIDAKIAFPYQIEYCSYKHIENLITNLNQDIPTIIVVSWGTTKEIIHDLFVKGPASAVGHYLVLSGYDYQTHYFSFLDPGNGRVSMYSSEELSRIWLQQSNLFIKKGSAVIFTSIELI